jgi:hypothetical protein
MSGGTYGKAPAAQHFDASIGGIDQFGDAEIGYESGHPQHNTVFGTHSECLRSRVVDVPEGVAGVTARQSGSPCV